MAITYTMPVDERGQTMSQWLARVEDGLPKVLAALGSHAVRRIVLMFPRSPAGDASPEGMPPSSHRGNRGFAGTIDYDVDSGTLYVGSASLSAALLHFGGTVHPKKARALAIPVDPRAVYKRPRDFADTFILRSKDTSDPERVGLIMQKTGKRATSVRALFVLRKSATIKPHPWLFWTDDDEEYLMALIGKEAES